MESVQHAALLENKFLTASLYIYEIEYYRLHVSSLKGAMARCMSAFGRCILAVWCCHM